MGKKKGKKYEKKVWPVWVPRRAYDPEKHCGEPSKGRGGAPCQLGKGWGTDHLGYGPCKFHFGRADKGRKVAQREMAEEAVVKYAVPRDIPPHQALLEELHRTVGKIDFYEQQIRALEPPDLVWGRVGAKVSGASALEADQKKAENSRAVRREAEFSASPSIWIQLQKWERAHLRQLARDMIACGIAEHQVRILEAQATVIAASHRMLIRELGAIFSFDPNAPEAREAARSALLEAAKSERALQLGLRAGPRQ